MTLSADPLYLDCHISLDGTTIERVRRLNRRVVDLAGGGIDFSTGALIPHLTLFMGLFPPSREARVRRAVDDLAGRFAPLDLAFGGMEVARDGYVFLRVAPTEALRGWHARVVAALDPLREGLVRQKFRDRRTDYSPDEQARIDRYGFPWVLEAWRPHVTIGFVDPARQPDVLAGLGEPSFTGRAVAIALGPVGEHGTVQETTP
ncbi:MAG: DUF1045 domain-containing protein [Candidatus Riflebacteria bacterium]|nr:DUF1045 domain-containing protein [Candidatus Riflebacteria bacterium]